MTIAVEVPPSSFCSMGHGHQSRRWSGAGRTHRQERRSKLFEDNAIGKKTDGGRGGGEGTGEKRVRGRGVDGDGLIYTGGRGNQRINGL
jgi:hypothetical protein